MRLHVTSGMPLEELRRQLQEWGDDVENRLGAAGIVPVETGTGIVASTAAESGADALALLEVTRNTSGYVSVLNLTFDSGAARVVSFTRNTSDYITEFSSGSDLWVVARDGDNRIASLTKT